MVYKPQFERFETPKVIAHVALMNHLGELVKRNPDMIVGLKITYFTRKKGVRGKERKQEFRGTVNELKKRMITPADTLYKGSTRVILKYRLHVKNNPELNRVYDNEKPEE